MTWELFFMILGTNVLASGIVIGSIVGIVHFHEKWKERKRIAPNHNGNSPRRR